MSHPKCSSLSILLCSLALPLGCTLGMNALGETQKRFGDCEFDTAAGKWQCDEQPSADIAPPTQSQLELDWIPKDYLTHRLAQELHSGCSGAYVDPLGGQIREEAAINTLPLIVEADSAEVIESNTATLEGDVRVSQGPRSIAADSMRYERLDDAAELSGDVTIRQQDILIRGESASVSTVNQKGKFTDARFVMHSMHMRGSAGAIEQDGPNRVVLREGSISSCEPNSNAWSLEGQELSVDQSTGQGTGKNVKLKLGGVPVFYLPYISFPVGDQRRSGFLFPSISSSDKGGLDISAPYYINLAPNYDLTLSPRLITGRGPMIETEFRHLNKYLISELSGGYLANDSGGNQPFDSENETIPAAHQGNNRWLLKFEQTGGRRTGWYSNIDYTQTSDTDYFRDLGTSSFAVSNTTYLNQSVDGGITMDNWHLYARIQDYQTLLLNLDAPYRKVPELAADALYDINIAPKLKLSLENRLTRFDHQDEQRLDGSAILTGTRLFTDYRIGRRFSNAGAYIHPEAGYKSLFYQLQAGEGDTLTNQQTRLTAGQFSLDLGAVFEHASGNFLQTLEPRAKYFFREYENHDELYAATTSGQSVNFDTATRNFSYGQLYRDTRFSGADRLDDANQVTLGLTNRWYSHDGHEHFNVSVGQINHFRDRRIGLEREITDTENASEWALEFANYWRNGSSLYGSLIYDDAAQQLSRYSTGYNYASENQLSLYSISYSYVRPNPEDIDGDSEQLDQIDGAFVAPVTSQWYVMGRANYDIENKQELETFLGFEYNSCCYRIRLLARRWLDSNIANLDQDKDPFFDQGVFFELHLKGLGGSGAKVNQILEDAIPGYRRREDVLDNH